MKKVLYIKANIKPEGESRTFKISDRFVEEYKKNNPEDEVTTLDLYKQDIGFLKPEDLNEVFGPKTEENREHHILKYSYQFADVDKYVIAVPMWNLGSPAILKAYMDYVCIPGITFKYTAEGPIGLCKDKKAVFIATRGGSYQGDLVELEIGERYIRTIFGFLGITDVQSISAEKLDEVETNVDEVLDEAINKVVNVAKEF